MKTFYIVIVFTCHIYAAVAQDFKLEKEITQKVIDHFEVNEVDQIYDLFNEQMKAAITIEKLSDIWNTIAAQCGGYLGSGSAIASEVQGMVVVNQFLDFENIDVDIRLAFDDDKKIGGLFFVPPVKKKRVDELNPAVDSVYSEIDFNVHSGDLDLPGTLTIPKNIDHYPIVIMVHGSGPNDRDESIGPNKPFRDIAHGLASHGIASLRYDRRTYVAGNELAANVDGMDLHKEVLTDAAAACKQADTVKACSKVFVLGHSLGAMLAPKIANENRSVAGIIMMAGNARPLEELIWEQYNYLMKPDGIDEYEQAALSKLKEELQNLESLKQDDAMSNLELPIGLPGSYWKSLNAYRQLEEIKSVEAAILILQGERDYQVTMEDFTLWQDALQGHASAEFRSYPKLNPDQVLENLFQT